MITHRNDSIVITVDMPHGLAATIIDAAVILINQGGEVRSDDLRYRLLRCPLISYAIDRDEFVGVAALKVPHDSAEDNVFVKAESTYCYREFLLELGFLVVSAPHRRKRLASRLIETLCEKKRFSKMFATVREENGHVQALLENQGFKRSGRPFLDRGGKSNLLLFIRLPNNNTNTEILVP